jgi:hypothetical protein
VEEHIEIPDVAADSGTIPQFQWDLMDRPIQKFVQPEAFGFMLDRTS